MSNNQVNFIMQNRKTYIIGFTNYWIRYVGYIVYDYKDVVKKFKAYMYDYYNIDYIDSKLTLWKNILYESIDEIKSSKLCC